jgi:hypothetical protein
MAYNDRSDYSHSRIFDVHRWSDHSEPNQIVNEIYDTSLNRQEQENARIKNKHLKVVLLGLFSPKLRFVFRKRASSY